MHPWDIELTLSKVEKMGICDYAQEEDRSLSQDREKEDLRSGHPTP